LTYSGQSQVLGYLDIIVAYHGNVLGNVQSLPAEGLQSAYSLGVTGGEDGGGGIGQIQEAASRISRLSLAVLIELVIIRAKGYVSLSQSAPIALVAVTAGGEAERAL
jgi:hypothetical protein